MRSWAGLDFPWRAEERRPGRLALISGARHGYHPRRFAVNAAGTGLPA
jgi:hypothetical protein